MPPGKRRFSPTIMIWAMNFDSFIWFSICCGAMYLPPEVLNISFFRSVIFRKIPSNSPTSPVCSHPSPSMDSRSQSRPVVVTHHHVWAAIKDFSVCRDLDFAARDDRADSTDFMKTLLRTID